MKRLTFLQSCELGPDNDPPFKDAPERLVTCKRCRAADATSSGRCVGCNQDAAQ